jgi:hypothetical protein
MTEFIVYESYITATGCSNKIFLGLIILIILGEEYNLMEQLNMQFSSITNHFILLWSKYFSSAPRSL